MERAHRQPIDAGYRCITPYFAQEYEGLEEDGLAKSAKRFFGETNAEAKHFLMQMQQ